MNARTRPRIVGHGALALLRVVMAGLLAVGLPLLASAQSSPDDAACQPPAPPQPVTTSVLALTPPGEPGDPLYAALRFRTPSGAPIRDLLVYVYHANANGSYVPLPTAAGCFRFHGALHGWARPDAAGQILVHTVRPGAYPRSTEPAHVHVVVQFPGRRGFYVNDIMFDDDPRMNAAVRNAQQAPGGPGIVRAVRDARGVWQVQRDIVLTPPLR